MRTKPKVVDNNDGVMAQYSGEHEGTWKRDSNAQSQTSSPESFCTSSPLYFIYSMCQPENFIRERSISQNIGKYKGVTLGISLYAWQYILSYQARGRLYQVPSTLVSSIAANKAKAYQPQAPYCRLCSCECCQYTQRQCLKVFRLLRYSRVEYQHRLP